MTDERQVLYVVTCATPAARDVDKLVGLAQERGWTVCVIATPLALRFIDQAALEEQTGYPVRSDYKQPGTEDVLPPADAIIVGGASFNTINKWALGISDTLALGLLTEAIGLELPLVVLPFLNAAQAAHPAFARSVAELRAAGVKVLLGDQGYEPHVPHMGSRNLPNYPWQVAVEALREFEPVTDETTWRDVLAAERQLFRTDEGRQFTYQAQGDSIVVDSPTLSELRRIYRSQLTKAIDLLPEVSGPGELGRMVRGGSYLWAILQDTRIRHRGGTLSQP